MRKKPNQNGLPLTLAQFSSAMIGYYFKKYIYIKGGQMLAGFPAFSATGGNNVVLFVNRQHHRDGLHIQRESGAVLLSPVRYIQPLVN